MKKVVIGGILGGLVYFIWGSLSWMVFPWHNATIKKLANEDAVMLSLRQQIPESGVYFFPNWPENNKDQAACDAYMAKHRQGPLGFMVYKADGQEPAMGPAMARGFGIDVLSALILAHLLSRYPHKSYSCRVTYVFLIGLFTSLTTHVMGWNWMLCPGNYTLAMTLDVVGGLTVAALVMAAIVKPVSSQTATVAGVVDPG